jgi:peptide/nickel transport system permease protein
MFAFDFGRADDGRDIALEIKSRMGPSLAIAIPTFLLGLFVTVSFALLLVFFRNTALDVGGVVLCVAAMSISGLFYIIGGQYLVSKVWNLVPISGYSGGLDAGKFLILPVLISVVGGIGSSARWYRTLFLEEINKDYVRTARAKGLSELAVLFRHVLKNAMIPILTGVVVVIPLLFMGSLLLESFFGIPGLGSYTIDAIGSQDFAVVRSMVFIGSVLYIVGLLLTDISYTLVDPRVRLFQTFARRQDALRAAWGRVARDGMAMSAATVLVAFVVVGLLDSLHYRARLDAQPGAPAGAPVRYAVEVHSVLDALLSDLRQRSEKTYSAPLATHLYSKEALADSAQREFPRLKHGGAHLGADLSGHEFDIAVRVSRGCAGGLVVWLLLVAAWCRLRGVEVIEMLKRRLSRVRHRQGRTGRALPVAEIRAHRAADRHADHAGDAAAGHRARPHRRLQGRLVG